MKLIRLRPGIKKWLFTGVLLMIFFNGTISAGSDYYNINNGLIKLGNKCYEIAFNQSNGGIVYILDKTARAKIVQGYRDGALWEAVAGDDSLTGNAMYGSNFTFRWDQTQKKLVLSYKGAAANPVGVTVDVLSSGDQRLQMQAFVNNRSDAAIQTFRFPYGLTVSESGISDALLPMIPGVKLRGAFFRDHQSYDAPYPGVMFADYLALRLVHSKIALYGRVNRLVQPVNIGFAHDKETVDTGLIIHDYHTWIDNGANWASPVVTIRIGQEYPATINAYRIENGIGDFDSLAQKLGGRRRQFLESPMYKMDFKMLKKRFNDLKAAVIDKLKIPGLIHPVAFQPNGHDHHYPDFLPPDAAYGNSEDLGDLVKYAQSRHNLVVPYTNFSWWNPDSPTMQNLPDGSDLKEIAVNRRDGAPLSETYASDGYVVDFHHDFAARRINAEHEKLLNSIGFDAIFEDQLGARDVPYDYNPAGLNGFDPATSYFEGVLAHTRSLAKNHLMTECGIDRLARDEIAFMGTNYLWDLLGYRKATAAYSDYYPIIGMLCRDKVLLYQHDLAIETWTNNKEMFRWNLAMGYNFSNTLNDMNNPWLTLVGVFQKYALSKYADRLVTAFDDLGKLITRTSFANYQVYANWDNQNSYSRAGHVIAPGGAMISSDDGSITAGVFSNYNQHILSEGEHYLLEVRSLEDIKVFQPLGNDTDIHIKKYSGWKGVKISAYNYENQPLGEIEASILKDDVSFNYHAESNNQKVAYYRLTKSNQPGRRAYSVPSIPDLVISDISWTPSEPTVGDQVTFQATVRNTGTGATPKETVVAVEFEIDGKPAFWSESHRVPLDAGATVTLKVTRGDTGPVWDATTGTHIINAWVDRTNKIPEISEINNGFGKNMPPVDEAVEIAPGVKRAKSAANLALNKPISSTGATAAAYAENLANDGFVNTYWESINNQFPASLTLDLGAVVNVNKVVLKLPPAWEQRFQRISLAGGAQSEQFKTIVADAEYIFDPAKANTVTIGFPSVAVRYLRLVFSANTGWPAGQIAELEFYAAKE